MGLAQPGLLWAVGGVADPGVVAEGPPAWTGAVAGIVAIALFVAFSTWVVVQRVRHGKDRADD